MIWEEEKEYKAITSIILISVIIGVSEYTLTNIISFLFSSDAALKFIESINNLMYVLYQLMFSVLAGVISSYLIFLASNKKEDNKELNKQQSKNKSLK